MQECDVSRRRVIVAYPERIWCFLSHNIKRDCKSTSGITTLTKPKNFSFQAWWRKDGIVSLHLQRGMHCQIAKQFHKNKMVNFKYGIWSKELAFWSLGRLFSMCFWGCRICSRTILSTYQNVSSLCGWDPCARILQGKRRQTRSGDYQLRIDLVEFLKLRIHPQSGGSTGARFGKLTSASFTLCTSSLNCEREIRMQECGVWNHSLSKTKEVWSQAQFKQD